MEIEHVVFIEADEKKGVQMLHTSGPTESPRAQKLRVSGLRVKTVQ